MGDQGSGGGKGGVGRRFVEGEVEGWEVVDGEVVRSREGGRRRNGVGGWRKGRARRAGGEEKERGTREGR